MSARVVRPLGRIGRHHVVVRHGHRPRPVRVPSTTADSFAASSRPTARASGRRRSSAGRTRRTLRCPALCGSHGFAAPMPWKRATAASSPSMPLGGRGSGTGVGLSRTAFTTSTSGSCATSATRRQAPCRSSFGFDMVLMSTSPDGEHREEKGARRRWTAATCRVRMNCPDEQVAPISHKRASRFGVACDAAVHAQRAVGEHHSAP